LPRGGQGGRTAVAASGIERHRQVPMAIDIAKTRGLCDWKCIFLQWITGSIFLKCGYPEKHNEINGLEAAIPCNRAVFNSVCDAAS
jgi:hypothetical protein